MKKTESESKKSKVLGVSTTIVNVIVVILAFSLGRIYPLPVCILAVIYFAVVLGISINKRNAAEASGEDTSELKREIRSNITGTILIGLIVLFQIWSVGGFQSNSPGSNPQTPAELANYGAREAKNSMTLPYE